MNSKSAVSGYVMLSVGVATYHYHDVDVENVLAQANCLNASFSKGRPKKCDQCIQCDRPLQFQCVALLGPVWAFRHY